MRGMRLCVVLVTAFFVLACGGSGDSPMSPSGTGARLNLMLTDSPFSDAQSLLVTFSEVTAHRSGTGGFSSLPFASGATTRTCDLKKLTAAQDILGTGVLPAGHYTMVRLVVSSAALYFDNPSDGPACAPTIAAPSGRSEPVEISSGEVRLNRPFDVPDSGVTTMLVDFDGDQSVRLTGNGRYMMNPVIRVVSVQ
jgi:hypothetical protein